MIADLHCDTVYECFVRQKTLSDKTLHIYRALFEKTDAYLQFFAHYIPEEQPDKWNFLTEFLHFSKTLLSENGFHIIPAARDGAWQAVLSVENCDVFADGDLDKMKRLHEAGVSVISLVYNHTNALGCGARSACDTGLSGLGREVVAVAGENGIILDVSHASYQTTEDIVSHSALPVLATHSNAYAVTPHPRNLRDRHIRKIAARGGLIGLNLYPPFLSDGKATIEDIARHLRHILDVGGADCAALGCDLDGVDILPTGIKNFSSVCGLFESLQHFGFSPSILQKVFYQNTKEFVNHHFGGKNEIHQHSK